MLKHKKVKKKKQHQQRTIKNNNKIICIQLWGQPFRKDAGLKKWKNEQKSIAFLLLREEGREEVGWNCFFAAAAIALAIKDQS